MKKTLIERIEVGSGGAASIEFTSIPDTYTDLLVVSSARTSRTPDANDGLKITFNNVGTGYSTRVLYGSGSSAASFGGSGFFGGWASTASNTASTFANSACVIPNYLSSASKSVSTDAVTENNATEAYQFLAANLWSNTAAITSIKVESSTSNTLLEASSFTLYGITSGSDGTTTVS